MPASIEVPKEEGFETVVEGHLLKKILQAGEGPSPVKGQEVEALYKGTLTNGDVFDSNQDRDSPFKFTVGVGQVIKGWDQGFASMKKGERAILVCSPDFAYGERGSPPKIPGGATLHFEVELLDFHDKKKEKWELSTEDKLELANKLKGEGNEHFKAGRNSEAASSYKQAAEHLDAQTDEESQKLLLTLRLNLSMAYLRTKQYSKAVDSATKVLEKESNNSKALFRRGTAHHKLQNFQQAKNDLTLLLTNEPDNADAKKELVQLKTSEKEAAKRQKSAYAKIFASNYYEDKKPEPPKPVDAVQTESDHEEEHVHGQNCNHEHKKEQVHEVKQTTSTPTMEVESTPVEQTKPESG